MQLRNVNSKFRNENYVVAKSIGISGCRTHRQPPWICGVVLADTGLRLVSQLEPEIPEPPVTKILSPGRSVCCHARHGRNRCHDKSSRRTGQGPLRRHRRVCRTELYGAVARESQVGASCPEGFFTKTAVPHERGRVRRRKAGS